MTKRGLVMLGDVWLRFLGLQGQSLVLWPPWTALEAAADAFGRL